ncbi:ABC transporter substrate-binding protein [Caenispirillum bisanense]|uniref:ABC transporter substrate-binding protein n=1 Tax=Caenispirillum bisanense TaxID=414052 RepID=UPI0031DB741E
MRLRALGAIMLAAGLGLSGLAAGAAAAPRDQVLDVVAPWEIGSLDPSKHGYVFTRLQIAETLVEADPAGALAPGLATAWTVSDDGLTWLFTVREGVRFHDGSPLTAEAAATALRHALGKPGILAQAPVEEIAAQGGAVMVRLREPFSPLPAALAGTANQILAPASYTDAGEVTQVIGTGPYRLDQLQPPQKLTAVRFDGYWGEPAAIERISYLAAGRGETRAMMAESGDADIVFTLDPASRARLARNDGLTIHAEAIPRTVTMKVNAAHPLLADPRARQAISAAIDRTAIATAILREPEAAAAQLFPPSLAGWHLAEAPAAKADPQRAAALLADLGWQTGGDGMLVKDGQPFRVTLRTFPDRPELPLLATAIQAQLREVGIDLQVAVGNSSEIPAGHRDGSLELALLARNLALVPDPLGTLLQDYAPAGGDWGAMNWADPRLTEILATLVRGVGDDADRLALQQEAAAILDAALPVIPVTWYQQTAAVSRSLDGFVIDPFERTYGLSRLRWAP